MSDPVDAPSHYVDGRKHEPRKVIEEWELSYYAGNVVKYLSRYMHKGSPLEDLRKAAKYLSWEIARLETAQGVEMGEHLSTTKDICNKPGFTNGLMLLPGFCGRYPNHKGPCCFLSTPEASDKAETSEQNRPTDTNRPWDSHPRRGVYSKELPEFQPGRTADDPD